MYRPAMVLPPGSKQSVLSCKSQRLMMEHGLIRQSSPGVYHLLPLALRSLEKLIRLIDEEMHSIGGTKISMPCMTTSELWKATNRWETNGPELFKVEDRHGIQYCLGPTHEEAVTDLIASQGRLSHKQLPLRIYQITRKFRDEKRPRFGLLRGREFYMKDMYTFDANTENAIKTYEAVNQAYCRLFNRLQLHFVKVSADTGSIGGSMSHEYHLPADTGEDELWFCNRCGFGANKELGDIDIEHCSHCGTTNSLESRQGIEVGHAFYLGTKYSKVFNADYSDSNNQTRTTEMGCYGLGVTRILAAAIEVSSTDNEIRWPHLLAPYQIYIIPSKDGSKEAGAQPIAVGLYDQIVSHLPHLKHEIILDDRNHMTIGKRMKEAKSLGYPFVIVIGKKALQPEPLFELCNVNTGETRYLNTCDLFCTLSMDVNII
ncbi:putative proline--tRNA ligase, mitochondrial [Saccoglossus kowalevskii]|uniref:proline--tRNA ligase n=1 Tax=Saccoglossus kowalevskii TaxID=10224 RepID=A0ABM0MWC4_SACKO|nr:PREDICTED: probable proline--tRNA ligase, mitochondrial-like [Saccoglossus kowalevskii]